MDTASAIDASKQVRTELRTVLSRMEGVLVVVEGRLVMEQQQAKTRGVRNVGR